MSSLLHPLALLCAVSLESRLLRAALSEAEEITIGRKAGVRGELDGVPVLLLAGGMGKANAAHACTALLERFAVRGVIGFGLAGAYPGSGLQVGDVALATHSIYADEGVEVPGGWLPTDALGIPLMERGELRRFNDFPLDAERVSRASDALRRAGIIAEMGPFLTVSSCSGTTARGEELARRFGALCEGMEGAATAHVCALYDVPFLELRGVSNQVEDRDTQRWRISEAAEAAEGAVRIVVRSWED